MLDSEGGLAETACSSEPSTQMTSLQMSKDRGTEDSVETSEVHVEARQHSGSHLVAPCVLCGVSGLTYQCEKGSCNSEVHPWCVEGQWLSGSGGLVCPTHSDTRKADWKVLAAGWSSRVLQNLESLQEFKAKEGKVHLGLLCTGTVFWYLFCSQYFPSLEVQRTVPRFTDQDGALDLNDLLLWRRQLTGNRKLDWLLQETESQLQAVSQEVDFGLQVLTQAKEATIAQIAEVRQSNNGKARITEDEWILKEIRLVELKRPHRDYLRYFENKEEIIRPNEASLSTQRLHPYRGDDDFPCVICGSRDYEDNNLIVFCDICDQGVHIKCYGLPCVPGGSWICQMCSTFGKIAATQLGCALCPNTGGELKQTVHLNDGSLSFLGNTAYHSDAPESITNMKYLWCHVFCALNIPDVLIEDKDRVESIHIDDVDLKRYSLTCEICKRGAGACVKCVHKKCNTAFHPECAKAYFLLTGKKSMKNCVGEVFCTQHRTFRLRREIELREHKQVSEIATFFREWEKFRSKRVLQPDSLKKWSAEERLLLQHQIEGVLASSCYGPRTPFMVTVQHSTRTLKVEMPKVCNLMESQVIVQNAICIPGRTSEECWKYYEKELFANMKKILEEAGESIKMLKGKKPDVAKKKNHKQRKVVELPKKRKTDSAKPPSKHRKVSKVSIPERPLVTKELFCLCRKPYVRLLPKLPAESEADYELKRKNNSMIQCGQCKEWYHLGCIEASPDVEDTWLCPICEPVALSKLSGGVQILLKASH